jgi:glycosyltransferase involved in cell wall biosynthesis
LDDDAAQPLRPTAIAMTTMPHISLITPVRDGGEFIADSVREMLVHLERLGESFELLVICDGSQDDTVAIVRSLGHPSVRVLGYPVNRGKGYAICYGIAHARGRLVGWLDADLDISPDAIVEAARRFESEPLDAVVGSKRHPASRVRYPRQRRVLSWGFQVLVRLLFRVRVRDTQVGAKLFRREMLDAIAPLLLIKRYAFDVEVLAVGAEFGFDRIAEVPVELDYRFAGTGISSEAVWRMLIDTLAIAYRVHLRHWYVRQYAALARRRMDALAGSGLRGERVDLPHALTSNLFEISSVIR